MVLKAGGNDTEVSVPYIPNEIFNLSTIANVSHIKKNIGSKYSFIFMLCNNYIEKSNSYGGIGSMITDMYLTYDGTKIKFSYIIDTK